MCAIVGCSHDGDAVTSMLTALHHRGPDHRGEYHDQSSRFSMGSCRLSIMDVSRGVQPMRLAWKDEVFVGVHNGEIYNFRALREELVREGVHFDSDCDTEVVVAAYAVWGDRCVQRFEGQWAFAVWAERAQQLFVCRDPLGIKPIYYCHRGDFIAFASEPKGLFPHPQVPKRPNPSAIQEYFLHGFTFAAGYALNHRSFYEHVESVPPGTWLRWDREGGNVLKRRYFDLATLTHGPIVSEAEAVDAVRDALVSSVHACMMGERPLGVALSGGLDSSIITAVAAKEASTRGIPLTACAITYEDQNLNEDYEHAMILREHLRAEGSLLNWGRSALQIDSYLGDLPLMIRHFDEPHWELKQLAMFRNYRELDCQGATVVLTGEGADELFFGYYHRFPGFKDPVISSPAQFEELWSARIPAARSLFRNRKDEEFRSLMTEAIDRFYRPYFDQGMEPDRCMQLWYLSTFLHWLLIDNDRCSMAFSLEGRFPFLNERVLKVAFRIPPQLQMGAVHGQEKAILRKAFSDFLPSEIRFRKKAPLPSPLDPRYHARILHRLRDAISNASSTIWDILDRGQAEKMAEDFAVKLENCQRSPAPELSGEELTRYITLSQAVDLRSPQIFGLLTLLTWWKENDF